MSRRRTRKARRKRSLSWLKMPWQEVKNPIDPVEWVSAEKVTKIHEASLWILENVGMAFMDETALDLWEKAGAKVDRSEERVWIGRDILMELIGRAPSSFTWHAAQSQIQLHARRQQHLLQSQLRYALRQRHRTRAAQRHTCRLREILQTRPHRPIFPHCRWPVLRTARYSRLLAPPPPYANDAHHKRPCCARCWARLDYS